MRGASFHLPDAESATAARAFEWPVPRAAYVHVPFCAHHCGYCNFTVVSGRDALIDDYLTALERELRMLKQPHPVDTLFIGGGTPTHLPAASLRRLIEITRHWFPVADGGEFSIEANPADLESGRCSVLAAGGVTRVSLGAQSFNAKKLRFLERDHTPADVARAVQGVRTFAHSVSLDLIFGTHGETPQDWSSDVEAALALEPDHLSLYGLTIERGSAFFGRLARGAIAKVDEEQERAMFAAAIDRLSDAEFEHYEISNFARPGQRCRHNEVYWSGDSYLAAGPGAARYIDGRRETNHRSTTTYLRRVLSGHSPVAESEALAPDERAREMLVLGLRRLEGVDRRDFRRRSGVAADRLAGATIERLVSMGLLADDRRGIRLTREGLFLFDSIAGEILSPRE